MRSLMGGVHMLNTSNGVQPLKVDTHGFRGEISLAHTGRLLGRTARVPVQRFEVMRQPLEDGAVAIARAAMSLSFPARFMLVAPMNPCPSWYFHCLRQRD